MKTFLDEHFLLENKSAERLYHEYAADMPIIDYHNHLSPGQIASDKVFSNITEAWLQGDHYKWRAMRANGIDERYITGDAKDKEKFMQWAKTVPYAMRNPLYHWTHLELQRYFNIEERLDSHTAERIYQKSSRLLQQPDYSTQHLLKKMRVEVVCTTDDPADRLEHHVAFDEAAAGFKMLPSFRPDKFLQIESSDFLTSIQRLEKVTDRSIVSIHELVQALQDRIDFFHGLGGRIADHGLSYIYAADFTDEQASEIFKKTLDGKAVYEGEYLIFKSAMLYYLARMYDAKGWTMQFHLGALRNNNQRLMNQVGADVGCDSIGDFSQAEGMSRFFNRLDLEGKLAKTIIYNLNPRDNGMFATMVGNYNDGSIAAKVQWGASWWFLDQKDGIIDQLNVLSNMGLLSRFVGMLTDSRSFLSFPRHEYFRRILCNLIGTDIEKGELPNDIPWLGKMIQDISYNNAKTYFGFDQPV